MVRRNPVAAVVVLVVLVLVGTGPLTGFDVTGTPDTFGEGNATIDTASVDSSALTVTDGRFGANVSYLRVPAATVTVGAVTDRPRLVYIVSVPGLGIERVESEVMTGSGTYRLVPDDRALDPDGSAGMYNASLSVRVQSFSTDWTVTRLNTTVEVGR